MKILQGLFRLWALLILVSMGLSCSQKSSDLPEKNLEPSDEAVEGVEEITGQPVINKPIGELDQHVTIRVGGVQYADSNLLVTLEGQISSETDSALLLARWEQIRNEGDPAAVILSPNQLRTQVLLPDVSEPTQLVFRLYGVDAQQFANSAATSVVVTPPADQADARVISAAVNETASTLDFVVALSKPANVPISVSYLTIDGSAIAGEDYFPTQGVLTFDSGETRKVISVELLQDEFSEEVESLTLAISGQIPDDSSEGGRPIETSGVGVIYEPDGGTNFYIPEKPIPTDTVIPPSQWNGQRGVVQVQVEWALESLDVEVPADLNLVVTNPCGLVLRPGFNETTECEGAIGFFEDGLAGGEGPTYFWQNAYWQDEAPAGTYIVSLEHYQGNVIPYTLYVRSGNATPQTFTGELNPGESGEVYRFEHVKPASSSSLSSSSALSSESSESSLSSEDVSSSSISSDISSSSVSSISSESSVSADSSSSVTESSSSVSSVSSSSVVSSSDSSSIVTSSSSSQSVESSSSESSSSSSSSSQSALFPLVELVIRQDLELFSPVISVSGALEAEPLVPVISMEAILTLGGEEIAALAVPFNALGGDFSATLDFSELDIEFQEGTYELQMIATDRAERIGESAVQVFVLRYPQPVQIVVDSPAEGEYYEPVEIAGSIAVETGLDLTASVSLNRFDDGELVASQNIPLQEDGTFSYTVSEEGEYRLAIEASDGYSDDSATLNFSYVIPDQAVVLSIQAPQDTQGVYQFLNQIDIQGQVNSNVPFEPTAAQINFIADGSVVFSSELLLEEAWRSETLQLTASLTSSEALTFGRYDVQLLVAFGEQDTLVSNLLPLQYRALEPLSLVLDPLASEVVYEPTTLTGTVTSDSTLPAQLAATLQDLNNSSSPQSVTLLRSGDNFSYAVDQPGQYEFTVVARAGNETLTRSLRFEYQAPAVSVSARHSHATLPSGQLDIVGPLNLLARIQTNTAGALDALYLELAEDGDPASSIASVELASVAVDGAFDVEIGANLADLDLPLGSYTAQLRVVFDGDNVAFSAPIPLVLRGIEPISLSLDSVPPVNFAPVLVSGTVSVDPSRSLDLSAQLIDLDSDQSQGVTLDLSEGNFNYLVTTPGNFRFTVTANDGVGSVNQSVQFSYAVPQVSVELAHSMPLLGNSQVVDLLDEFTAVARVESNNSSLIQSVSLQVDDGDGWRAFSSAELGDVTSNVFSQTFTASFEEEELSAGDYSLRIRIAFANQQVALSNVVQVRLRDAEPLLLTIDDIGDGVFYRPIALTGSASGEALGQLELTATLDDLSDELPAQAVTLDRDGSVFSYLIAEPSLYLFVVTASDNINEPVTQQVVVEFIQPSAAVTLGHPYPEQEDGSVDTLGHLDLIAQIQADPVSLLNDLTLQVQDNDQWQNITTVPLPSEFQTNLPFQIELGEETELAFGRYPIRLSLSYDNRSRSAVSEAVVFNYRDTTTLNLTLTGPDQPVVFEPFTFSGTASADPLLTLSLSATLTDLRSESEADTVSLVRDGDEYRYTLEAPGEYRFAVTAADGLETITRSEDILFETAAASVVLEHEYPLTEAGDIETLGAIDFVAQVQTNNPSFIQGLAIEWQNGNGWSPVQTVVLPNTLTESMAIPVQFDFADGDDWDFGVYQLRFRLAYAGLDSVVSDPVSISYREAAPLSLVLDELGDAQFFAPVVLSGQASADPLRGLELSASLTSNSGEGSGTVPVTLFRTGDEFRYSVDVPGSYTFLVSATDGVETITRSVNFTYNLPNVGISLEHDYELLENGAIDSIGDLQLLGRIRTNSLDLLTNLTLEYDAGDGAWQALTDVNWLDQLDENALTVPVVYRFDPDLPYGLYRIRLQLNYGDGESTVSSIIPVEYRAVRPLVAQFQEGIDDRLFYNPVTISWQLQVDPLLRSSLEVVLEIDGVAIDQVPFQDRIEYPAPAPLNGEYVTPGDLMGDYELSLVVSDGQTETGDEVVFRYQRPEVSIELSHELPIEEDRGVFLDDLSLQVGVTSNMDVSIDRFVLERLQGDENWQELADFDYVDVWDAERNLGILIYQPNEGDSSGDWDVRVRADISGLESVYSAPSALHYRQNQSVSISILSPEAAGVYFGGISVVGDFDFDPLVPYTLNGSLENFDQDLGPQSIELTVDGNQFFASVDQPGTYSLSVTISDEFSEDTAAVSFAYVNPELFVASEPQHPLVDDAYYDVTGDLTLWVTHQADGRIPVNEFILQSQVDGQWQNVQRYPFNEVWQPNLGRSELVFDFVNNELEFGAYNFRVMAVYAEQYQSVTDGFAVQYRQYQVAQVNLVRPDQGALLYLPFSVLADVSGDRSANLALDGEVRTAQTDELVSTLRFSETDEGYVAQVGELPDGEYQVTVTVDDDNTESPVDAEAAATFRYLTPDISIQLLHQMPILESGAVDLFDPFNAIVQVENNVPGLVPSSFDLIWITEAADEVLNRYPAEAVWDGESQASIEFDFSTMPEQLYPVYVQVNFADGIVAQSAVVNLQTRSLAPLSVAISSPDQGESSPLPVTVVGTVQSDSALPYSIVGRLRNLDSEDAPQVVQLQQSGTQFSYPISDQGRYQFSVTVDDGRRLDEASVDFSYLVNDLAVQVRHDLLVDADGVPVTDGPVSLFASVTNPDAYPIRAFAMELQNGDQWVELLREVVDGDASESALSTDFREINVVEGAVRLRVRVDYLDTASAFSLPLDLNFRAFQAPAITSLELPRQGVTVGSSLGFEGTYRLDPAVGLEAVLATFYGANSETPLFGPVTLNAADGIIGDALFDDRLPEASSVAVQVIDQRGAVSQVVNVPVNFVFADNLYLNIVEPGLPVYSVIEPRVSLFAEFYPLPGLVDLQVRLLDAAGTELLVDPVEEGDAWSIESTGSVSGTLDLSNFATGDSASFVVEVQATYPNSYVVSDSFALEYAPPAIPEVQIRAPQPTDVPYSLDVSVSGVVFTDELLGADGVTGVFGRLEIPGNQIIADQLVFDYAQGEFFGSLPEGLMTENGFYRLVVWAQDRFGRSSEEAAVEFTYQQAVDLAIQVNSPEPSDGVVVTATPRVLFSGRVQTQQGIQLVEFDYSLIQDNEVVDQASWFTGLTEVGEFNQFISFAVDGLGEGTYEVLLTARDSAGREAEWRTNIVYQALTAPEVILEPIPNEDDTRIGQEFIVYGFADARLTSVEFAARVVHADNTATALEAPEVVELTPNGTAEFVLQVPDAAVAVGVNRVQVFLNDGVNETSGEALIEFALPTITIVDPQSGVILTDDILDVGFVVDYMGPDSASVIPNLSARLDGESITLPTPELSQSGFWSVRLDLANIPGGDHLLELVVHDYRRDSVTSLPAELAWLYETRQPPVVTIVRPDSGSTYSNQGVFNFGFVVDYTDPEPAPSQFPVVQVWINEEPATIAAFIRGNGDWNLTLNTDEFNVGRNVIRLEVQDYIDEDLVSEPVELLVNFQPPKIQLSAFNADGSTLRPLAGNVALQVDSDLPLTGISVGVGDSARTSYNFEQGAEPPYTVTLPARLFVTGTNVISVDAYYEDALALRPSLEVVYLASNAQSTFDITFPIGGRNILNADRVLGVLSRVPSLGEYVGSALYIDGARYSFAPTPSPQNSYNWGISMAVLKELSAKPVQILPVDIVVGGSNSLASNGFNIVTSHSNGREYLVPDSDLPVLHMSLDGQGLMQGGSAQVDHFGAIEGGVQIIRGGGGNNTYYFDEQSGIDIIEFSANDLNAGTSNLFRYGGSVITAENIRFAHIIDSSSLFIYSTLDAAPSWQIVTSFFELPNRPINNIQIWSDEVGNADLIFAPNVDEAPPYAWTRWLNQDKPSLDGDYELVDQLKEGNLLSSGCDPIAIQAQSEDGTIYWPGDLTLDSKVIRFDPKYGFACENAPNDIDGECADYQVRFLCAVVPG